MNRCDNCDWRGPDSKLGRTLGEIHHLAERLDPGGEVPAGECPKCGALAYPVPEPVAVPVAAVAEVAADRTPMQVFTRSRGKSPRRVQVVYGAEAARAFCQPRNERRNARQRRNGFFYEFANLAWYVEAFGR